MTVLSACQSAIVRLVGRRPAAVFSSADQLEIEVADLANEAATAIMKANDWQALTKLGTVTGDGTALAFNLPSDYDRFPVKQALHSSRWELYHFVPALDLDQWLDFKTYLTVGVPGYWTLLGGQLQIQPVISNNETAQFYYISKEIVRDAGGTLKTAFDKDTDTFLLPERLLTLSIIWRWRAQKRLDYGEDMRNYEIALSEEIGRERGPRMFAAGSQRYQFDTRYAYPGPLGQ